MSMEVCVDVYVWMDVGACVYVDSVGVDVYVWMDVGACVCMDSVSV